ncbi:unnamed protein product [Caenorhabditis sp. 36 PRJEB53466]|nr:unnamed protein product [Caenorhabditis sp. 36 PRJEB53466]
MIIRQAYSNYVSNQRKLPLPKYSKNSIQRSLGSSGKLRLFESEEAELHSLNAENSRMKESIEKENKQLKKREQYLCVVDTNITKIFERFEGNNSCWQPIFEDYNTAKFSALQFKREKKEDDPKYTEAMEKIQRLKKEILETESVREQTSESAAQKERIEALTKEMKLWELKKDLIDERLNKTANEMTLKVLEKVSGEMFDEYMNKIISQFKPVFQKYNQSVEGEQGEFRKMWRQTVKTLHDPTFRAEKYSLE